MAKTTTLVLGASENPERYSFLAVQRLRLHKKNVIAIGNKAGQIGDTTIVTTADPFPDIDTVTLYLNPRRQEQYYSYILSLHPRRLIFNPGTENEVLAAQARTAGILVQEACTLVLLSTGQY
jgi:uncharacterized protein